MNKLLHKLLVSDSCCPYYNLACEDWLLRHYLAQQPMIFCYINKPSVVIGRGQNPWLESNIGFCQQNNIALARRQSGGGTVFHDSGNLNISFICPRPHYDKPGNLQLICQLLAQLDIEATPTVRHDIVTWHQNNQYKISGSAFRESKDRAFHHLTLLVNSDLTTLKQSLTSKLNIIKAQGTKSVRSPTINLQQLNKDISIDQILEQLQAICCEQLHLNEIALENDNIDQQASYYQSEDWIYHKTPPFTVQTADRHLLHFTKGRISQINRIC